MADAAEVRVEDSADLTAKARIRNAAPQLFATRGAANTSIREVATAAGITHGLVVHHFANKDGLRQAVRQHAIELLGQALEAVPGDGTAAEIRRAGHERGPLAGCQACADGLPAPSDAGSGRIRLRTDRHVGGFHLAEVRGVRSRGLAATQTPDYLQAMAVMVRELGPRLLAPVAQQFWSQLTNGAAGPAPDLEVAIKQ